MKSLKTCTSRNAKRGNHFICFSHYSLRARSVLFLGWIDFDLLVQWYVVSRQRKVYVDLKIVMEVIPLCCLCSSEYKAYTFLTNSAVSRFVVLKNFFIRYIFL